MSRKKFLQDKLLIPDVDVGHVTITASQTFDEL